MIICPLCGSDKTAETQVLRNGLRTVYTECGDCDGEFATPEQLEKNRIAMREWRENKQ